MSGERLQDHWSSGFAVGLLTQKEAFNDVDHVFK